MKLNPYITVLLAAMLGAASKTHALDWADGKGQVHGFFSQGMVATSDNNFYGDSADGVSWDFREIGLNASYRATPGILLSAQVMSRRAGEMDTGALWVDYAFADFTLLETPEKQLGVRVGRMKNPFGLYTETRDVAFTRPGVIVPQPIYFDRSRKFALSGDGVHLYGSTTVPGGTLDVVALLGKTPINDRSSKAGLVGLHAHGDLEQNRLTPGIRILYETENGRWRGGVSYFDLSQVYHPVNNDRHPRSTALLQPWILSLQYTGESWTVTGEYSQRNTEVSRGALRIFDSIAENWYVQGQYRFHPGWELLLRYDSAVMDKHDRNGSRFAADTGGQSFTRYARDRVAGLRYDVTPNFMVRGEWHHVTGTVWLSSLDNPNPADLKKDWDMFMLLGSWHF